MLGSTFLVDLFGRNSDMICSIVFPLVSGILNLIIQLFSTQKYENLTFLANMMSEMVISTEYIRKTY